MTTPTPPSRQVPEGSVLSPVSVVLRVPSQRNKYLSMSPWTDPGSTPWARNWTRHALSLGAGKDSTALYLLACDGLIRPYEVAIFSDTMREPKPVYAHLDRLEEYGKAHGGAPIVRVKTGDLGEDTFTKRSVSVPVWILKADGTIGKGGKWCTDKYKTRPINAYLRKWANIPARGCKIPIVRLSLGIATEEATRRKTSKDPWLVKAHPLLTTKDDPEGIGWSRDDCQDYLDSKGFADTPKSACVMCAYHSDELWAEIKHLDPEGFEYACTVDERIRYGTREGEDLEGATFFLHRSCVPLRLVILPPYVPGAAKNSVGCSPFSCARDGSQMSLLDFDEEDVA